MRLFDKSKKQSEVKFETPQSIEFKDKTFHLSGNFLEGKEKFAESIIAFGGKVRGIKETKHLNFSETNYFIFADDGVRDSGAKKPYGKKVLQVQSYNEKNLVKERHIPIIRESHCLHLMKQNQPKP